jgi:hypothetical protein
MEIDLESQNFGIAPAFFPGCRAWKTLAYVFVRFVGSKV